MCLFVFVFAWFRWCFVVVGLIWFVFLVCVFGSVLLDFGLVPFRFVSFGFVPFRFVGSVGCVFVVAVGLVR